MKHNDTHATTHEGHNNNKKQIWCSVFRCIFKCGLPCYVASTIVTLTVALHVVARRNNMLVINNNKNRLVQELLHLCQRPPAAFFSTRLSSHRRRRSRQALHAVRILGDHASRREGAVTRTEGDPACGEAHGGHCAPVVCPSKCNHVLLSGCVPRNFKRGLDRLGAAVLGLGGEGGGERSRGGVRRVNKTMKRSRCFEALLFCSFLFVLYACRVVFGLL